MGPRDKERQTRVSEIKEQVAQGAYDVDARAVADAILRRLRELTLLASAPAPPTLRQRPS